MSVSQLINYDCQAIFNRTTCRVHDHSGTVIGASRRYSGVYVLDSLYLPFSTGFPLSLKVVIVTMFFLLMTILALPGFILSIIIVSYCPSIVLLQLFLHLVRCFCQDLSI